MRFLIFGAALLFAASARAQTTLTATPTIVAPGGTVTAAWSGIASPSSGDALFMYPSAGGSSLTWRYTTGAASGSVPFTIASWASPGSYVLRLYSGSGAGLLATSNNFTVAARTIAGSVTLGGSPLAGVSFAATNGGNCTASDASGNYVCGVANGSTTADGNNTYTYDIRGRMVQAVSGLGTTDYKVNALGQRMRKTNSLGDTVFHYDSGGRLIAETGPTGTLKREVIYLGDIPVAVVQ